MAIPRRWPWNQVFELVSRPQQVFQITEQKAIPAAALPKQAVQLVNCLGSTLVRWCRRSSLIEMRPPPRSTRAPRNPNALNPRRNVSPPSASSATTETAEQRVRRIREQTLINRVQRFSMNHRACRRVPIFFTPSGRPRPVEEVAKELVGHFLISTESNLVVQIVETEAYQAREEIYRNRFPRPPPDFRSPAGSLVSYRIAFSQQLMFITAGADDSGDLVLLRTCNGVYGNLKIAERVNLVHPVTRHELVNAMSGPTKVAKALAPELRRDCNLLRPSHGLYLVQKDPNPLIMLDGPRLLPRDTARNRYSTMRGADSRFRFAFDCAQTLVLRSRLRRAPNQP